jgi:hypothetical protein
MTCCGQLPFNEQSGSFRRERTFVIVAAKVSKEPIVLKNSDFGSI